MSQNRLCLKCNHKNPDADMSNVEACPKCFAIYSRVESHLAAEQAKLAPPALDKAQPRAATSGAPKLVPSGFVTELRVQSLYPTFRSLINLGAWLLYCLAALIIVVAFNTSAFIGALIGGLVLIVFTKVMQEVSLMVADLADASIVIAARVPPP